jgi:hypothetical protein
MPVGTSQFSAINPTTVDDATTIPTAVNDLVSLLDGSLSADSFGNQGSNQNLKLTDATNFPSAGWLTVGKEIISYTGKSGNILTGSIRAAQSTVARAHVTRSLVSHNFTADHYNMLRTMALALQTLFTKLKSDTGTTDGTSGLTLSLTPIPGVKVLLFVNGQFYQQLTDFTVSGTALTFSGSTYPPAGYPWLAYYFGQ